MRKSFFVYILTRSTKSCSRYSLLLVVASPGCFSQARLRWEVSPVRASSCVNYIISLFAELGIDKEYADANRAISSIHLSPVYSGGSTARWSVPQTSPTMSLQKTGEHSISISRSVSPFSFSYLRGCPVSNLKTFTTARLDTHHSRCPYACLPATSQRVRFAQRKSASPHRGASPSTHPPSQPCPIRCGCGRYKEDRKVHTACTKTRNPTRYDFHLSSSRRG